MYKEYSFYEHNDLIMKQLETGAFLTTKVGKNINTMTIGWGNISIIWNKHIFIVYVRYSRETYKFLEQSNEFTVSFPINVDMNKELRFVGTKSFRDIDKIKELNLCLKDGKNINTPIIDNCDLHLECKIIFKQSIEPELIPSDVYQKFYKNNNDYHVCYFGEIVTKYGRL